MIRKNLFRTDSRPAPALWAALFHHDDKPAAATKDKRTKPAENDSAATARQRMIERGLRTADTQDDGSITNAGIQKGYGGAYIDK